MIRSSLRRLAAQSPALALVVLGTLLSGALWTVPASAAEAETASIDHAQPADGAVRLLVTVPGTEAIDLDEVAVTIGGKDVATESDTASDSDDVQRTSILAIDTSNSMRGTRIAEAKKAAAAYLGAVPANVKVGVLTFDTDVEVVVPAGTDRDAAREAIAGLTLTQDTALYDGVLGALRAAGPNGATAGQRKVLLLSDGKDTTKTTLTSVVDAVKKSGVTVDVVSLQQGDEANAPLNAITAAGKGTMLNTADPTALSEAFAAEADDLARQIVVTAELPKGSESSANVAITVPAGSETYTTSAYLPVRVSAATTEPENSGPVPVTAGRFAIPKTVMFGGVGAMGVGLVAMIGLLAIGKPRPSTAAVLTDQMSAYGAVGDPSLAPKHRDAAPEQSLADQAKQAAARALANNKSLEAKIASRLEGADVSLKPAEWLLLHGMIAVGAGLLGTLLGGINIFLGVVFLAVGAVVPWIWLGMKKSRRLKAFNAGLADTLQLMSGSLSAGLSLAQSIDTIVREGSEPVTSEFKRVVIESRLGVTLEDSLEGVAERMESQDFEWVVMAIRIQREVGGNLAELLLTVAATIRERDYLRRHVRALSAEGRLSAYVLGGLPPGFLAYLSLTKWDYTAPMFTTPIGWAMIVGMSVLLGVGFVWMMKVSKVDI